MKLNKYLSHEYEIMYFDLLIASEEHLVSYWAIWMCKVGLNIYEISLLSSCFRCEKNSSLMRWFNILTSANALVEICRTISPSIDASLYGTEYGVWFYNSILFPQMLRVWNKLNSNWLIYVYCFIETFMVMFNHVHIKVWE